MLLHINPTRQRGKRTGSLARASGWYMTFFAAGVIFAASQHSGHCISLSSRESGCSGLTWTGAAIRRTMPVAIGNFLLDCDSLGK